jgi:histidinol phosphatase-like PHP family hydrolase
VKGEAVEYLDVHGHTNLSYCASEDLTLEVYREALDDPNGLLARQGITNHGFQAYFPPHLAWSWVFLDDPSLFDRYRARGDERLLAHGEEIEALRDDRFLFGVEVELMADGRLTVSEVVREKVDLVLGSLHVLPRSYEQGERVEDHYEAFLAYNRDLAASGVHVIAHPFRWVWETTGVVAHELVAEFVRMAAAAGVAVELNLRGGSAAHLSLIREAAAARVPLAFGTDSHAPHEVGRLEGHIKYLDLAGFEPADIVLYDGPRAQANHDATG